MEVKSYVLMLLVFIFYWKDHKFLRERDFFRFFNSSLINFAYRWEGKLTFYLTKKKLLHDEKEHKDKWKENLNITVVLKTYCGTCVHTAPL